MINKICIISPSLKLGGIERALTTLAKEFELLGKEVHFISCLTEDHFYKLPHTIKIYQPNFKRKNSRINKILFYPKLLIYLRKTINKINPDRVLVFGDWFSPITLLALIGTNYPIYISDRTIPNYKFGFPIPQLKQWLYPKSAGFIAQTQRAKDYKIKQFGNVMRIEVIPNALPEFKDNKINTLLRDPKLVYVGRFAWEKDPEILIRAFEQISRTFPNWTLQMAGSGPLLGPMKALVKELLLEEKIFFLGEVSEVSNIYQSASIFVLPSVVEGFPNALIEAMSFGLQTVCFSDITYEDIITNNIDGFVVKERSLEALKETIELLIRKEEFRYSLGSNAIYSVKRFDKQNVAKKVLAFMNK